MNNTHFLPIVVRPHTAPFPVPRPRRRTASLKIKTESKPLADDEDIYTDNSPVTNQITNIPPLACQMKPRKVAWADQADSKLETEPLSSMGFGLIPTPTSSVGGDLASTGLPPTQELSQRELTLNRVSTLHFILPCCVRMLSCNVRLFRKRRS